MSTNNSVETLEQVDNDKVVNTTEHIDPSITDMDGVRRLAKTKLQEKLDALSAMGVNPTTFQLQNLAANIQSECEEMLRCNLAAASAPAEVPAPAIVGELVDEPAKPMAPLAIASKQDNPAKEFTAEEAKAIFDKADELTASEPSPEEDYQDAFADAFVNTFADAFADKVSSAAAEAGSSATAEEINNGIKEGFNLIRESLVDEIKRITRTNTNSKPTVVEAAPAPAMARVLPKIDEKINLGGGVLIDNGIRTESNQVVPSLLEQIGQQWQPQPQQQMAPSILNGDNVNYPQPRMAPATVQPIPKAEPVPVADSQAVYDNTAIIKKYPVLGEIQKINLDLGQQVQMINVPRCPWDIERGPTGLIGILLRNPDGSVNMAKSATIDTGKIVDGRKKLLAGVIFGDISNENCYENLKMFSLFEKTEKGKEELLNKKLIKEFFTGGVNAITSKPAYDASFVELNKKLAMITLPTAGMKNDQRKQAQSAAVIALKSGIIDKAISLAPGSRFRFAEMKDPSNFHLSNSGMRYRYLGHPIEGVPPVEIHCKDGKFTIVTLDSNLEDIPV